MNTIELSDRDGDALTVTADARGIWITCTTEGDEVTVGPFLPESLSTALDAAGAYARTA